MQATYKNARLEMYWCDNRAWLQAQPSGAYKLIVTDPPYGLDYESDVFGKIEDDKELPVYWIEDAYRILRDGGAMYVFCHWKTWSQLEREVLEAGFAIKNMIVLKKSNHGRGDLTGQYAPKHELLMFATRGRHVLRFPYKRSNDVLDVPWFSSQDPTRIHATEKPLSWMTQPIINSSEPGETVVDLFGGSGATAHEALKNGRCAIHVERDPFYFLPAWRRLAPVSRLPQIAMDERFVNNYVQEEMF